MQRRYRARRAASATVLTVAVAVAALLTPVASNAAERPASGFFGVNATGLTSRDFRMFGDENVGVLRTVFPFTSAKSEPGQPFQWGAFDSIVRASASRGVELIPILYGTAPWISPDRSAVPLGDEEAVTEWRDFLLGLVERYGRGGEFWADNPNLEPRPIETWQIWNEPNSKTWWGPQPKPSEYALLLKRSAVAIRSVDPQARIMTAGIVARPTNRHAIPGSTYIRRLLSLHRGRESIDILAIHPYAATIDAVQRQITAARSLIEQAGIGSMPIWVTEIGWGTKGPRDKPLIKSRRGQIQALRGTFAMTLRERERLNIGRVLWYHWRDARDDLCQWCNSSGLLGRHYEVKKLALAFRKATGG